MPNRRPTVSVLVTAFRRREFLLETLRSLERQTAPPGSFEVVVVKDFTDEAVEREIDANGWKSVHCVDERLGPFITEAVEKCSGDVISFLDDDDLFESGKVERVADVFSSHPELGYYHNSAAFINEQGDSIKAPYAFNFSTSKEPDGEWMIEKEEIPSSINSLIHLRHDFNRSSISVRKEILMKKLDYSRKMLSAYDSFIFFSAALGGCSLLVDSRQLTRYRFNRKSVSMSSTYSFSRRQIQTYTLMHNMALEAGEREIANLLERQILFFNTINAIHSPISNRGEVVRAALSFVTHFNRYSRLGNTFAGLLSAAYVLSPKLSKSLYSKLTAPEG